MTRTLQRPVPIHNVDGSLNEAGSVKEVVDLVLQFKDHLECALFTVTNLGKQKLILGFDWLHEHNPEVDWKTSKVKMSHCPQHCRTCFLDEKQRRKESKRREEKIQVCQSGPMPEANVEIEDVPELMADMEEEEDYEVEKILSMVTDLDDEEEDRREEFEEGDEIFYTALHPEEQECICTYATISTWLAEAWHKQNNVPKTIPELVPQLTCMIL